MNTISEVIHQIARLLGSGQLSLPGYWSYLVLALLVAVEGPIATLIGAAAASAGFMQLPLVFIAAAAGNLTADSLWYSLGYAGKTDWLLRFGKRLGINPQRLEDLQHNMRLHASKILFAAKLSMSLMIPSLIAAGLVKVPWKRWFPAIFGGEMIWTGSLVLIGYYATQAVQKVEKGLAYFIPLATLLFVLFVLWLARNMLRGSTHEEMRA